MRRFRVLLACALVLGACSSSSDADEKADDDPTNGGLSGLLYWKSDYASCIEEFPELPWAMTTSKGPKDVREELARLFRDKACYEAAVRDAGSKDSAEVLGYIERLLSRRLAALAKLYPDSVEPYYLAEIIVDGEDATACATGERDCG
jgi:hypothetical protein